MDGSDLVRLWLDIAFGVVGTLLYLYVVIKKKRLIKWEKAEGFAVLTQAWQKKYDKQINLVLKIILGLAVIMYLQGTYNIYKDIPYMINNEYSEISGIVCKDQGEGSGWYPLYIEDEHTGKVRFSKTRNGPAQEGQRVTVQYLPNSKYGRIVDFD